MSENKDQSNSSVVFYESFFEAIQECETDADKLAAYEAIVRYGIYGELPDIHGTPKAVFIIAKPIIDKNIKKRENGKKGGDYGYLGGRPPKNKTGVIEENPIGVIEMIPAALLDETPNVQVQVQVQEQVKDKEKVKGKKDSAARFTPPTVEEVREYCRERNNNIDPEAFVDYYQTQKWKKANGQPVSDWQGCVRTWEKKKNQPARIATVNPKIHNFPERKIDYAELENKLTQN